MNKPKLSLLTIIFLCFAAAVGAQTTAPQPSPNAPQTVSDDARVIISETNVDGLKVIFKRRPKSPTVAAGLFLRGGSFNLTAENAGIENFALSVMSEAGTEYPRERLRRELARTGTSIAGSAGFDYSVLQMATTRENFDSSWEVFTDVALHPKFATEDVERVRAQLIQGLQLSGATADSLLDDLADRAAYAGTPYANEPAGTVSNLKRFTVNDLQKWHTNNFQKSNLLLVVVGDLSMEVLRGKIAQMTARLPLGNYTAPKRPNVSFDAQTVQITTRDLPTNYIKGVFAAPAPDSPDIYAMRVATAILQDRVFDEVRVKRNLSYAPNAALGTRALNTGEIYVTAVEANRAVEVMLNEVERLQNQLVTEREISGIAGAYLTNYYLDQETNLAQVSELAKFEMIGGGWRNSLLYLDQIRQVKPEDVRSAARKYYQNFRFIVVGNPSAVTPSSFRAAAK